MQGLIQEFGVYGLIVLAIFLLIEALHSNFNYFIRDNQAVNLRLRKLKSMRNNDKVFEMLRYKVPAWTSIFPSFAKLYSQVQKLVYQAGVRVPLERLFLLAGVIFIALTVAILPVVSSLFYFLPLASFLVAMLVAAAATAAGFFVWLGRARRLRMHKFLEQLPDALEVLVRGLRAGHPVTSALELVTTEMPDPIGTEFGLVADEIAYGLTLKEALTNLAERLEVSEVKFFAVCVSIQYDTGGNLAEILSNLAQLIRRRFSLMRKVKALSSEGRMSALILTALPLITASMIILFQPSFYGGVSDDEIFWPTLLFMGGLYLFGVYVIRRMVDIKV